MYLNTEKTVIGVIKLLCGYKRTAIVKYAFETPKLSRRKVKLWVELNYF